MKRFFKAATVEAVEGGWTVMLDGKPIRTPAKTPLVTPNRALAAAAAAEWDAQPKEIDPRTMPVTRALNSTIDRTIPEFDGVVEMVAEYAGSDLICYRADAPAGLVARQSEAWDPLIAWAETRFGARLIATTGIMHVSQPAEGQTKLRAEVAGYDPLHLTGLYDLTALSGSLIIGFAVVEGRLSPDQGWLCSRIDADWQEEQWGVDDEAARIAAIKAREFAEAARFIELSRIKTP